ncbi:MAG: tagatose 1,6-diphosphate aldolase [Armatimonadetes bacterium]|nr:tagatose 1,6-diphosphate aldolase [Armatimonadota bacterium]MDW8122592.1 tagatose 1,6-diphosphate aldolase [Armatimonadota bacterium]
MATVLSAGKWQRLRSLTDSCGRFQMMAIDQRDSMRRAIGKVLGKDPKEVAYEDLAKAKETVTKILAPYATAVLTDPVYGYPYSIPHLPPRVGLLLAYEETGYEKPGDGGKGRLSRLIFGWSVEKALKAGADAVKLLIYYHPDAPEAVCRHQEQLVQKVGEECAAYDIPFLLELVSYALEEPSTDSPEFAAAKPSIVIRSAEEFSKPHYGVDILKLEFPADLKFTREFCNGAFDGKARTAVYSLSEVEGFCKQLNEAAATPWVILSAGVDIAEFLVQVELACRAGASGFLCGRAIWKDAINLYPDIEKMEQFLSTEGVYNFLRANAYAQKATPWFQHRKFAGLTNIQLEHLSPAWHQEYAPPTLVKV